MDSDSPSRGRLKIFLGYNSGVGKSFRMLDEGRRRYERGQDVLVGGVQPHSSAAATRLIDLLPRIPMRRCENRAVMDMDAILSRRPQICLVDGMAYDNPASAPWPHRWQEIEALRAAGISVLATVNLQFIAERQQQVAAITGRVRHESIPLACLHDADELEVVDAPSGEPTDARLREMALLLAAEVVEHQLESYLRRHGIDARWGTQECIVVCPAPGADSRAMMASAQRNAGRFGGEWVVAGNEPTGDWVAALLQFARARRATQVYVHHEPSRRRWTHLRSHALDRLLAAATDMDVRVFPR